MAKKKVVKKRVAGKPTVTERLDEGKELGELSFYECEELKREIDKEAAANEGVLSDEQVGRLVDVQVQSVERLTGLCRFIKLLEAKEAVCGMRSKEITEVEKKCGALRKRIAGRLAVWVDAQGKSYHAGEFMLTTRLSTTVEVVEGFNDPFFCSQEMVLKVNKKSIKEALVAERDVDGAELKTHIRLTIK